jgi:hypothetical protein
VGAREKEGATYGVGLTCGLVRLALRCVCSFSRFWSRAMNYGVARLVPRRPPPYYFLTRCCGAVGLMWCSPETTMTLCIATHTHALALHHLSRGQGTSHRRFARRRPAATPRRQAAAFGWATQSDVGLGKLRPASVGVGVAFPRASNEHRDRVAGQCFARDSQQQERRRESE